jgi:hypothetical protein
MTLRPKWWRPRGIEPPFVVCKTTVLPLDDGPVIETTRGAKRLPCLWATNARRHSAGFEPATHCTPHSIRLGAPYGNRTRPERSTIVQPPSSFTGLNKKSRLPPTNRTRIARLEDALWAPPKRELERMKGIEPSPLDWHTSARPSSCTRKRIPTRSVKTAGTLRLFPSAVRPATQSISRWVPSYRRSRPTTETPGTTLGPL